MVFVAVKNLLQAGATGFRVSGARHVFERPPDGPPKDAGRSPGGVHSPPSQPQNRCSLKRPVRAFLLSMGLVFAALYAISAPAMTPPGTLIPNTATVDYTSPAGDPRQTDSNTVDIITVVLRSNAIASFLRIDPGSASAVNQTLGPTACDLAGSGFQVLADPVLLDGSNIDPLVPQPVVATGSYHIGEPVFVQLVDSDQNLDMLAIETVTLTLSSSPEGDSESIRLSETGVDTGLFAGYVPTVSGLAIPGDCVLQVGIDGQVQVDYTDPQDASDNTSAVALIDPVGLVFDSRDGQPVDGVSITLIDETTGQPATVLGDDGVSQFPSTVISGATVTDSGGTVYPFGSGEFRFPLIASGSYRLQIATPQGYAAPSIESIANLQILPGAPWALGNGSFEQPFVVDSGMTIDIDVPVDPVATELFLRKGTVTAVAAPGDFLQYTLTLDNASSAQPVTGIVIVDTMPPGFRYIAGSTRIDGLADDDPQISSDGMVLSFDVDPLDVGMSVIVKYVTEVTVGVTGDEAINHAQAFGDGGAQSNVALASVRLTEDLFTDKSILVGRVILGSCDDDVANDLDGVAGIRVYLEDGRFAVTDDGGRYHFEGLEPGNHVVQMDVATVPEYFQVQACEKNTRFAGRAYSQFVDLQPGNLWRADFHLRMAAASEGEVRLNLASKLAGNHAVRFELKIDGSGVAVANSRAMVLLPDGLSYLAGSSSIDGQRVSDYNQSGPAITFPLTTDKPVWSHRIVFGATYATNLDSDLVTKAMLIFDSPTARGQKTPIAENRLHVSPEKLERHDYLFTPHFPLLSAELSDADQRILDQVVDEWRGVENIRIKAVGHSDKQFILPGRRYADNYELSEARAETVAAYFQNMLGLSARQVEVEGKAHNQPLVAGNTEAAYAQNRRVELFIWGDKLIQDAVSDVSQGESGSLRVEVKGLSPYEKHVLGLESAVLAYEAEKPSFDDIRVEGQPVTAGLLWPPDGFSPHIPSTKIAIRHLPTQVVEVSVNEIPVSPLSFDGTAQNRAGTIAISRWRGVDIANASNLITAVLRDSNLNVMQRLERKIHYAGGPEHGELILDLSHLTADGTTRPVLAIQMVDRWGKPARYQTLGAFRVSAPYRSWWEVEQLNENPLLATGNREPMYSVAENGMAYIELEPTTQTGEAIVTVRYNDNREQEFRVWLEPEARDWILVGFAEGTVGYNTLNDNTVLAEAAGFDEEFYDDSRMAFFAKGRIKGEYLLTLSYDTDRDTSEADRKLFGTIDPDRFYTLYGDATEQRFDAVSQEKLYVKLERNQFYALFGDFDTGLTITELSRYNRSFNGFKSELQGQNFAFSAFVAETDTSFVKDEIQGDGTSGLYQLSNSRIIINSEKISIRVQDRFRSEIIIEEHTLTRHLDYNIDYLNGTLFFKQPVRSRDENFNPIFIVADYETHDSADEDTTGGGRVAWRSYDSRIEVGASYIHEGDDGDDGDLGGVDFKVRINDTTEIRAEYAYSDTDIDGVVRNGSAYLAEIKYNSYAVDARAYLRELEQGFGLGQQRNSEEGTRKMGVDGRVQISDRLAFNGELFRNENLETDADRNVAQAELIYSNEDRSATVGLRSARDEDTNGVNNDSDQAFVGGSIQMLDRKVTLRASSDITINDNDANVDYPNRYLIGMDYRANDAVTFYSEYETSKGDEIETQMTRMGVRASPWDRAQFDTSVSKMMTEYGPRTFANLGLTQGWQFSERLALDFGLDHSKPISEPTAQAFDDDTPLASGSLNDDFFATFAGATYQGDYWSATSRLEYRNSDVENRWGLVAGFYREEIQGHGFSTGLSLFDSDHYGDNNSRTQMTSADLRLSWAWRPADSAWILLDRMDLIIDKFDDGFGDEKTWRMVNNLNANWMINRQTQLGLQYGGKLVRANFDGDAYTGYTDLIGVDFRRDLNEKWDVGMHFSSLHSWESEVIDYGIGFDVGYLVGQNMWLSVGYNFDGFDDDDFSRNRYTAQGPFITFRIKVDQDSVRQFINDYLKSAQ